MSKARIIADYAGTGATTDLATQAELDTVSTVASAALPKAGGAMTGAITTNSTFDGVDVAAIASVPANLVAYRASGESTPSGWSEYTSCRGRMIVGLPSGGSDGGTVGTVLDNLDDRTHNHTLSSHTHPIGYHQSSGTIYMDNSGHVFGQSSTSATPNTAKTWTSVGSHSSTGISAENSSTPSTANTGTSATSDVLAYIQLMTIKKD